jgi:hypothetical protein
MCDKWSGSDIPFDISDMIQTSSLYIANSNCKSDDWFSSESAIKSLNQHGISRKMYDIGSLFPENEDILSIGPFNNVSVLIKSEPETENIIKSLPDGRSHVDPKLLRVGKNAELKKMVTEEKSCICSNCGTIETTLWRRTEGRLMCNPCALYFKLHGVSRPLHLLNGSIRRRRRRSTGKSQ